MVAIPMMESDAAVEAKQVGRQFHSWLRYKKRPSLTAAALCKIILDNCEAGLQAKGRINFNRALEAFRRNKSAELGEAVPLSATRVAFRSTLDKLIEKSRMWSGFQYGEQCFGIEISYENENLLYRAVGKRAVEADFGARKTLQMFYDCIDERKFAEAWNHLEPEYQSSRWSGDVDWFVSGYESFYSIQDLQILPRSGQAGSAVFDVFFEEEQFIPLIPSMSRFLNLNLGEARSKMPELIESLALELRQFDVLEADFNRVPLKHLLRVDAPISIPWELKIPHQKFRSVYTEAESILVRRVRRVYMTRGDNGWRIRRIITL